MDKLYVLYSTDQNYCMHLGISLTSLLENNKKFNNIIIYIIEKDIDDKNKSILLDIVNKYNRKRKFISFNKVENRIKIALTNSKSKSIYARLFISNLIPESVEKILYLDCDTIVDKSLYELWNLDIEDCYVAGVQDIVPNKYKDMIGMSESDKYINSGVLLINLRLWRKITIEDKFLKFIELHNGEVPHHDQGIINGVCKGKISILNMKYNVNTNCYLFTNQEVKEIYQIENYYDSEIFEYGKDNPTIIHFTPGFVSRPWVEKCRHPKQKLYFKYRALTLWKSNNLEKDKRNLKIKIISKLYFILPKKIFINIYKKIV